MINDPYAILDPPAKRLQPNNIEIGPNDISIDLLRAIYRCNQLPLHTRMRAAMAALKHEVPALAVQALITEQDIATVLDRRIANYERLERERKLLEHNGSKTIEQSNSNSQHNTNQQTVEKPPIELRLEPTPAPLNRLYDKRHWRRF